MFKWKEAGLSGSLAPCCILLPQRCAGLIAALHASFRPEGASGERLAPAPRPAHWSSRPSSLSLYAASQPYHCVTSCHGNCFLVLSSP